MEALFRLSIRQLTGKWRLLLLVLLAALPVGLAIILTLALGENEASNSNYVDVLLDALLVSVVMPVICLVLATATLGNELEDRTLSYLTMTPIPRHQIVFAKLLSALVVGIPLVVISGVITTVVGDGGMGTKLVVFDSPLRAAAATGVALLLGTVAYSTAFMWAGLMTTRALPFALIYVLLWEGVIASFFGGIRYISVRGYTLGLVHGLDEVSFGELGNRAIEFPAALVGVVAVSIGFFVLTVRRLQNMDVP